MKPQRGFLLHNARSPAVHCYATSFDILFGKLIAECFEVLRFLCRHIGGACDHSIKAHVTPRQLASRWCVSIQIDAHRQRHHP